MIPPPDSLVRYETPALVTRNADKRSPKVGVHGGGGSTGEGWGAEGGRRVQGVSMGGQGGEHEGEGRSGCAGIERGGGLGGPGPAGGTVAAHVPSRAAGSAGAGAEDGVAAGGGARPGAAPAQGAVSVRGGGAGEAADGGGAERDPAPAVRTAPGGEGRGGRCPAPRRVTRLAASRSCGPARVGRTKRFSPDRSCDLCIRGPSPATAPGSTHPRADATAV